MDNSDLAAVRGAHDDEIEAGCNHATDPDVRAACRVERLRRLREAAEEADDVGSGDILEQVRSLALMDRPPSYAEAALRRRADALGVEVPRDFGTARELVPRARRPNVVWARRVGDVTYAAMTHDGKPRPRGVAPEEFLSLELYDRRGSQHLGHLTAAESWGLADDLYWLAGEEAATIAEARALVSRVFAEMGVEHRWRRALAASSDVLPFRSPAEPSYDASLRGATVRLPVWLRGAPHRVLGFASAAAARRAGWGSGYSLVRAESSLNQCPVVVVMPGLAEVLTRDGRWVSYEVDPRDYPETVRDAHPEERARVAAELARR